MPKRYEKVEFKSFANGISNTDFIEENAFGNTFQIEIKNNKASIDEVWTGYAKPSFGNERDMEVHNGQAYLIDGKKVYKFNGTSFSVFQDLGGFENIGKIFSVGEKLFVTKGTEGVFLINEQSSLFNHVSGTDGSVEADSGHVALSDDGSIYFFQSNGTKTNLKKTNDDFVSATTVFNMRSGYSRGSIANINGFIYFAFENKLMRVTKTGVEVAATSDNSAFMFSEFGREYVLLVSGEKGSVIIEYFDGFQKKLIKKIKNGNTSEGEPFFDGHYTYIEIYSEEGPTSSIFKIDKEGNSFKIFEANISLGYPSTWVTRNWGGTIIFSSANDSKWYKRTADVFSTAGYIESGIISKGEHAPIRIIARHKPLLSNTGIKIYYSKDRSGSYGASVFTNAVAGSVRTEYDFPNTVGKVSFMELKIELTSSDSTKTPEDVEFDYIYKPLGLETSV